RLEQADYLLLRWDGLAPQHPALGLRDNPLDQRAMVGEGCPPELGHGVQNWLEPRGCRVEIGQHRPRDLDQITAFLNAPGPAAGELDGERPSLGRAPAIAP